MFIMWNGFIGQRIAATTKNLWRWSVTLFLVAVGLGVYGARTFLNAVKGPARLSEAQLGALSNPSFALRDYATVQGTKTISTGVTEIEKTTRDGTVESQSTTAEYVAMIVGSRILIVKTRPGANAQQYTGALVALPGDVRKQVLSDSDDAQLQAATLNVMLDASEDYGDGLVPGGVVVGLLLLISLWTAIKAKRRSENPEVHPICKSLSKYGPLYILVPEIDEEARTAASTLGGATFTRNWVISCWLTKSLVIRRDEIVWVYKKRTRHSVNFIPTGTSYGLAVRDSRGKLLEISAPEQNVDAYLVSMAQQTPWVVFGYDRKIEKLYKKPRSAFVGAVLERKTSMQARTA